MMTNEQILQLAEEHLEVGGVRDDGSCSEYYGTAQKIADFSRAMYENGWEDRSRGEYLNPSCPN
jgi:hypothetical protein